MQMGKLSREMLADDLKSSCHIISFGNAQIPETIRENGIFNTFDNKPFQSIISLVIGDFINSASLPFSFTF
jgi:hypothetical protein